MPVSVTTRSPALNPLPSFGAPDKGYPATVSVAVPDSDSGSGSGSGSDSDSGSEADADAGSGSDSESTAASGSDSAPPLTSGQHDALAHHLQPYEAFPREITGRTVWTAAEYGDATQWKRVWAEALIVDLEEAYERFKATGLALTAITRDTFPLSDALKTYLGEIRDEVVNGSGFALVQGLPVERWGVDKSAAVYLGIGTVFGWAVSQNAKGHVLGHVKDLGNDPTQLDKVRIYSTSARQFFHADDADIVALLCLHKAMQGGESDVVSAHHLWNTLQRERPDVARLLVKGDWYFDRKGEVSAGQNGWVKKAVFYWHDGRLISHHDPYFIKSVGRFVEQGLIPAHTPEQLKAIQVLEDTAQRLALHMVLAVGDMQFVADTHVLHARTAYTDHPAPLPRRHLLRLWLSTPVSEGGWNRPFPDNLAVKRGGVQVNGQAETCPLEAE